MKLKLNQSNQKEEKEKEKEKEEEEALSSTSAPFNYNHHQIIKHTKSNSCFTSPTPSSKHLLLTNNRIKYDSFSTISSSSASSASTTSTSKTNHHHHHHHHSMLHNKSSSLELDRFTTTTTTDDDDLNSIEIKNPIQQNIIRTRFQSNHHHHHHHLNQTTYHQSTGLEVIIYLKLSIPYRSLLKLNSRSIIIPLLSDHNLRLKKSIIFPLTRKSIHSKPTLQAIPNRSDAERTASILNLAKSFRITPDLDRQPPAANISVRNFSISILINLPSNPESHSNLWNHHHAVAEYAVVLESICLWTTIGPDWPYSVIIPTPTCLRNSFRLMLPPEDEDEDEDQIDSIQNQSSNKTNVITFPTLRRERSTLSSTRNNDLSTSKSSSSILDEESKSLTDESEPDYSGLSEDDEISLRRTHWTQDESSNRYEGVFQSTNELCVSINHQPTHGSPTIDSFIKAQRAQTNLAISIHRGKNHLSSNLNSLSLSLNFQVTLYNLALKFDQPMIPFVFHLPDHIANQIISSEWSGITGDSVIESLVPFHDAQPDSSQAIPPAQDTTPRNTTAKQIPSFFKESSLPDLELLHTSAPFEDSPNDPPEHSPWGPEDGEVEASFENSFSTPIKTRNLLQQDSSPQIKKLPGDVRGRFVVWFDLASLIRYIDTKATSQDKLLLKFNLHGQIEIGIKHEMNGEKALDLPLFGFPTVEQHTCIIDLSVDPSLSPSSSELDIRLPSSATRLGKETEDENRCQIQVDVRRAGPEMGLEETVKLYHSKPVLKNEAASIATLQSPIQALVQDPMVTGGKPRLKKRYSATPSKYRHAHTISSGSLPAYRKRTPLPEQLKQIKSHETQVSDQEDEDDSEMKLTIASADLDISFLASSSCQYLDLSLQVLKDGGSGKGKAKAKEDQGMIGMEFVMGLDDQLEVIEGWIGSRRLEVGNGIEILGKDCALPEKSIDLKLCLFEYLSNLVNHDDKLVIRLVLKIKRSAKQSKLKSDRRFEPFCVLPTFSKSVSILDVKIRNPNETKMKVMKTSLNQLSKASNSTIHFRQYTIGAGRSNELILEPQESSEEERSEEMKIEGLSWIEKRLERYDFSWKTVLSVWSLYLILSLGFEINQLHSKFDSLEKKYTSGLSFVENYHRLGLLNQRSDEVFDDQDLLNDSGLKVVPMEMEMEMEMEMGKTCPLVPLQPRPEPPPRIEDEEKESFIPIKASLPKKNQIKEEETKAQRKFGKEEGKEEGKDSSVGEQFGYFEKLWISIWMGMRSMFGNGQQQQQPKK